MLLWRSVSLWCEGVDESGSRKFDAALMAIGVGLELGPSSIRVVVLERSGSKGSERPGALPVRVVAWRDVACETTQPEALTRTLSELRRALRLTTPVVLGIPSTSAILATVNPLIVNVQRAALAVQFELQQQLPFELSEAAWHYHWLSETNGHTRHGRSPRPLSSGTSASAGQVSSGEPGAAARRSAVTQVAIETVQSAVSSARAVTGAVVAAMRRSLLEERLACCRRAGLLVGAVSLSPIATLNVWAMQSARSGSGTVALLHVASEQMAEWIVQTPEMIQVMPVSCPSSELLWQEIAASWEALRLPSSETAMRVSMIGPEAVLPRLQMLVGSHSDGTVDRFDLARLLTVPPTSTEPIERSIAAVGLALQGLKIAHIPLNLIETVQRRARWQQTHRAATVVSVLCTVAMLGLGVNGMLEVRHRRLRILQSLEQKQRLYQSLRPEVRELLKRQHHLQQRTAQLERLGGEGSELTQGLAQVAAALPDTVWLTKLECTKSGAVEGTLEGRAKSFQDVTQFFERLKSVAGMTNVKPLSTNVVNDQTTGKEVVTFVVQVQRQPAPSTTPEREPPPREKKPARTS